MELILKNKHKTWLIVYIIYTDFIASWLLLQFTLYLNSLWLRKSQQFISIDHFHKTKIMKIEIFFISSTLFWIYLAFSEYLSFSSNHFIFFSYFIKLCSNLEKSISIKIFIQIFKESDWYLCEISNQFLIW